MKWITVPVHRTKLATAIKDTEINHTSDWATKIINAFDENYRTADYYAEAKSIIEETFKPRFISISQLNQHAIKLVCRYLNIHTNFIESKDYQLEGAKTDRLLQLLQLLGAREYLSGPSARAYLEEHKFRDSGIRLEYIDYQYRPYPQLWGEFQGDASIVDLIANCGPESQYYLENISANRG